MRSSILLLAIAMFTCVGCPQRNEQPAAEPLQPKTAETPTPALETATPTDVHMGEHFAKTDEIRTALIAGRLEDARPLARWIAEHQQEIEHPAASEPYIQRMRLVARDIASAQDLTAATKSFVTLAEACADCHEFVGGVEWQPSPPPGTGAAEGTRAHMARHQWALDQMWVGLIAPSRSAWIAGAEVLAEAPLAPEQLAPNQTLSPEFTALADRVHELGNLARDVPDSAGMPSVIYGELLTTCETCHASLRPPSG